MNSAPSRDELDRLAAHFALDAAGTRALLEAAGAVPPATARRRFLAALLRIGGLLSIAASLVFFVAANWDRLAVYGRFALLEAALLACAIAALFRPPPHGQGRAALFLAFVVTGALLALFGQTYQTGADVHELFLAWAMLGLPFAILAAWSVSSAAWLLILDVALLLFCGGHPTGGLLWMAFGGGAIAPASLIAIMAWVNIALWFIFEHLQLPAVPGWVRRMALSAGSGFACWAGALAIVGSGDRLLAGLGVLAAMAAVAAQALRQRRDIYPLAVVLGSFIFLSVVWLADLLDMGDAGAFLLLALWLIGSSTAASRVLTTLARQWRVEAEA